VLRFVNGLAADKPAEPPSTGSSVFF